MQSFLNKILLYYEDIYDNLITLQTNC
jgi:hypothetical protein